eukprot:scaffold298260_cov32-Tisochrysis_lutea.AAC.2
MICLLLPSPSHFFLFPLCFSSSSNLLFIIFFSSLLLFSLPLSSLSAPLLSRCRPQRRATSPHEPAAGRGEGGREERRQGRRGSKKETGGGQGERESPGGSSERACEVSQRAKGVWWVDEAV